MRGACGNRIISVVARGRAGWSGQILVPAVWARATSWTILNLSQIARMAASTPQTARTRVLIDGRGKESRALVGGEDGSAVSGEEIVNEKKKKKE